LFIELQVRGSQVPWTKLQGDPAAIIENGIPPTGILRELLRMIRPDLEAIYDYWYGKQEKGETPLTFKDMRLAGIKGSKAIAKRWVSPSDSEEDDEADEEIPRERGKKRSRATDADVSEEVLTVGGMDVDDETATEMDVDVDDEVASDGEPVESMEMLRARTRVGLKRKATAEEDLGDKKQQVTKGKGKSKEQAKPARNDRTQEIHPDSPAAATNRLVYLKKLSKVDVYQKALKLLNYAVCAIFLLQPAVSNFFSGLYELVFLHPCHLVQMDSR
jgi:hypothetical protein